MPIPWPILVFFIVHWQASVFFQTFFQHRYGAHRMFTLSKGWERFFHLMTYVIQGSSYLNPRAYAILHRMHHAYSDTEKDPHSPVHSPNPLTMMNRTRDIYRGIQRGTFPVEARFLGGYPEWPILDRFAHRWMSSILWGTAYTVFYLYVATAWWHLALLPFHFFMGPTHGAIVNWFGHWMGYRNFDTKDVSRNTLVFDFVTMGELFQNNHHNYGSRPNFGVRWFEVDPAWPFIWMLDKLGIAKLRAAHQGETPLPVEVPVVAELPPDPAQ
jgi:stearoyl-CoA desaturase (Delta-9 desaturase)